MIYFFHGSDVEKTRAKVFEWVAKARAKEPNLAYVRLAREELTPAALEDATLSSGLFVKRLLVLIDDPFPAARAIGEGEEDEVVAAGSLIEDHLDNLAASDNAIIILAPKLAAAKAKKIAALAKKVYEFEKTRLPAARQGFNAALVNALAARDRGRLWLEVIRALRAGDAPEMLHGLLHWKARDILERGSRAWNPRESRQLSLALIAILQNSRRSSLPLAPALERFALSM